MAKKQSNNQSNTDNKGKVVKTVRTTSEQTVKSAATTRTKVKPTESRGTSRANSTTVGRAEDMIFNKQNYIFMGVGLVLIIIGFMLMSGGAQAPDSWNPGEIYSFRRTVLAPFVILAGLVVEIFAIFKK